MTETRGMSEIASVMSNFDREIDRSVEAELKTKPNTVFAGYPGWNFYARVWFNGGQFVAEVLTHRVIRKTVIEDDLESIMETVSNEYGWD